MNQLLCNFLICCFWYLWKTSLGSRILEVVVEGGVFLTKINATKKQTLKKVFVFSPIHFNENIVGTFCQWVAGRSGCKVKGGCMGCRLHRSNTRRQGERRLSSLPAI